MRTEGKQQFNESTSEIGKLTQEAMELKLELKSSIESFRLLPSIVEREGANCEEEKH